MREPIECKHRGHQRGHPSQSELIRGAIRKTHITLSSGGFSICFLLKMHSKFRPIEKGCARDGRRSALIRCNQRPSEAIRGHRKQSEAIGCNQRQSPARAGRWSRDLRPRRCSSPQSLGTEDPAARTGSAYGQRRTGVVSCVQDLCTGSVNRICERVW